jgi:hypothetical protein
VIKAVAEDGKIREQFMLHLDSVPRKDHPWAVTDIKSATGPEGSSLGNLQGD